MNRRAIIIVSVAILLGYGLGALSYRYDIVPFPQLRQLTADRVETRGFDDVSGRVRLDCATLRDGTAVMLTLGQSNSANHGETRYRPQAEVFNFNFLDGQCYRAEDPLLGATGRGGSVWSRLADRLVTEGVFERVLIAPIGVGASEIRRWTPAGDLHWRITDTVKQLRGHGLEPTHVLWHQGEADARLDTPAATYVDRFRQVFDAVRSLGVDAPIFVAITSICNNPGSEEIRRAQAEIIRSMETVYRGAESDALDRFAWRYDGCHFSDDGLRRHADLWYESITSDAASSGSLARDRAF